MLRQENQELKMEEMKPAFKNELQEMKQAIKNELQEMKQAFKNELQEMKIAFEESMKEQINKAIVEAMDQKIDVHKEERKDVKDNAEITTNKTQDKRKKINKKTRQLIADKQKNACGECKLALTPYFELDHIIGLQFGGTDEESNLMALCRECHAKKSIGENQCRKQIQDAIKTILRESETTKSS